MNAEVSLSPTIDRQRHEYLKAEVLKNNASVHTWGKCLQEISDTKSYVLDGCASFADWVRKHCTQSIETVKKLIQRERAKSARLLVADTTEESHLDTRSITHAQNVIAKVSKNLMPAKQDPDGPPVEMHPPQTIDIQAAVKVLPADVIMAIHQLARDAKILMHEGPFAISERFRHLAHTLEKIDAKLTQQALPGFGELMKQGQKSRGTWEEVKEFCGNLPKALTVEDAEWFFRKCEGCGWKNAGKAIVDWRQTVRAWQLAGYFPSQKGLAPVTEGGGAKLSGAEMMVRQKELEDCQKRMDTIRNSYDSHQDLRPKDREELKRLGSRRQELKTILGIRV